jgi:hypothetical protein
MGILLRHPTTARQPRSATSPTAGSTRSGHGATANPMPHLQRMIGNQALQRLLGSQVAASGGGEAGTAALPGPLQAELVVGQANDPLEHQADRIADQVMGMPAPPSTASGATLHRTCACQEASPEEGQPSATLRAKQHSLLGPPPGSEAPAVVHEVLGSAGQPLDAPTRAFFEPRFGRDFSQVRAHADDRAARSAQSIGALAYTVGPHIVFAQDQYAPGGDRGKHLLAHELAHTVQQGHSRIQRRVGAMEQGVAGLVDIPEETSQYHAEEASPVDGAGPIEQTIRRSATWTGATVHETLSPAETPFGGDNPITWHLLNGTKLQTPADADGAINVPHVTTLALPSTGGPATNWMAKVDTVPAQVGSGDETVLGPGPWTKVVTKAAAGGVTGLPACTGAGNSTFSVHGKPSDDAVYKANRRHEDHHLADHKVAFDDAIGKWDKNLQDAKNNGTEFKGASAADATAALWTAMGNTPQNAARSYRAQGFAKGAAFHTTPAGGPMSLSNPVCNADCSTSAVDVTNPS